MSCDWLNSIRLYIPVKSSVPVPNVLFSITIFSGVAILIRLYAVPVTLEIVEFVRVNGPSEFTLIKETPEGLELLYPVSKPVISTSSKRTFSPVTVTAVSYTHLTLPTT